jgi:protein TonB
MFTHLIESSSHKKEFERRGTFFLGTIAAYALLIAGAGVASIYAYDAQLGQQNLDTAFLVTPFTTELLPPRALTDTPRRHDITRTMTETNAVSSPPVRQHMIEDIRKSMKAPDNVGTVGSKELPALPNARISTVSSDSIGNDAGAPAFMGGSAKDYGSGKRSAVEIIEHEAPPDVPHVTPIKKAPPVLVSLGVINGRALHNPVPVYPSIAKTTHTAGTVNVQVLLNEEGRVISAHALSGPALLRDAAVKAAYQAKFSPTLLSHQPVKVSGIITYNFKLE